MQIKKKSTNIKCIAPCVAHIMVTIIMLLSITIKLHIRVRALVQWTSVIRYCLRTLGVAWAPNYPQVWFYFFFLPFQEIRLYLKIVIKLSPLWCMCLKNVVVTPGLSVSLFAKTKVTSDFSYCVFLGPHTVDKLLYPFSVPCMVSRTTVSFLLDR